MGKILWCEREICEENENLVIRNADYVNKHLTVFIDYLPAQAQLKAMILSQNKDGRREIEYFYQRYFVGIGEDFYDEMLNKMELKQGELELIASGEDL